MTGENFKRINRKRDIRKQDALEKAKRDFTLYANCGRTQESEDFITKLSGCVDNWNFDTLNALEYRIEQLTVTY